MGMCRPFQEHGTCKYGDKCQFAHGINEIRNVNRHPKYKTDLCRTYHSVGFCPYGPRCHFIHALEEMQKSPERLPREEGYRSDQAAADVWRTRIKSKQRQHLELPPAAAAASRHGRRCEAAQQIFQHVGSHQQQTWPAQLIWRHLSFRILLLRRGLELPAILLPATF